jgi:multiple sugar transport system permease protein
MGRAILWTPALGLLAAVFALPAGQAVWTSLHRVWRQLPGDTPFVGLDNYRLLVASDRFWAAVGHTALFTAASVTVEMVLGIGLALLMHRTAARWRGAVRGAALVPWALPTVVAGLMWAWILHDRYGIANHLLVTLGVLPGPLVWLGDPTLAMASIIAADVWKTTPYVALIALAGLGAIDRSVYEAGSLDGATGWRAFVRLTLPLLRPALLVALLFRTVDALRIFDLVFVLTRGGPGGSTETISLLAYEILFQELDVGRGSAMGLLTLVGAAAVAAVYLRLLRWSEQ